MITKYCAKRKSTSTGALLRKEECVCERDVLPQKKVRKCELAGMRSKNKPPKQNTMRNEEEEGMKEERARRALRRRKGHF